MGLYGWVPLITIAALAAVLFSRRSPWRSSPRARIGAVVLVLVSAGVLMLSVERGWLADERRDTTRIVYERRGPLCGFVRNLPGARQYVGDVPCQVWNLMPLTGLGAIAAGWLAMDLLRSAIRRP